jgi:hypothetical protein
MEDHQSLCLIEVVEAGVAGLSTTDDKRMLIPSAEVNNGWCMSGENLFEGVEPCQGEFPLLAIIHRERSDDRLKGHVKDGFHYY